MYTYRYNFANEGLISSHKNVFAYILCLSVVDHNDVTVDEMVYLASELAGDAREDYSAYLDSLVETWHELKSTNGHFDDSEVRTRRETTHTHATHRLSSGTGSRELLRERSRSRDKAGRYIDSYGSDDDAH